MEELQWIKPLMETDFPEGEGFMPVWDSVNEVWTFVPREIWNPASAKLNELSATNTADQSTSNL